MTRLQSALSLAAQGFYVFPCLSNKIPAIKDWQKLATRDTAQINTWFESGAFNIGVYTGRFGDDGALVVVDVDNKHGKHGDASLLALELAGREFPPTRCQRTPTGGSHLIYLTPQPLRQGADVLGEGLDIRSRGGFILAVGSSIGGVPYTMDSVPLAQAPDWLIDACGIASPEREPSKEKLPGINRDAAEQRGIDYLTALEPVPAGQRNDAGFRAAARLKDLGCDPEQTFALMAEHWPCEPMLEHAELQHVVRSAYAYGREPQGADAPETQFEPVPKTERKTYYDLLTTNALMRRPRPRWLVHGLLPREGTAVLYGAPGSGKTFVTLDLCGAIARGVKWAGHRVRRGRVLYVGLEGHLRGRVEAYLKENQLLDVPNLMFIERQRLNFLAEHHADVRQLVGDIRAAKADDLSLIVVDTLNRSMPGGNENASEDMGRAIECAGLLSRAFDCLVVLVHHSGKDAGKGARGHSSLLGAADAELEVSREPDSDTRYVEATKVKDGVDGERYAFALKTVDLGATRAHDPDAEEHERDTSCVVNGLSLAPSEPGVKPGRKLSESEHTVMRALRVAIEANCGEPVHVHAWREHFERMNPVEFPQGAPGYAKAAGARAAKFARGRAGLANKRSVVLEDEHYRIPDVGENI